MPKYIAMYSEENGNRVIQSVFIKQDDYEISDNEVELSEEVYNAIQFDPINHYTIMVDNNYISDINNISIHAPKTNNVKVYASSYHTEGNKKWINSVEQINEDDFDPDRYLAIDKNTYCMLSSFGVDLELNVFYVDANVSNVTIADLKKSEGMTLAASSKSDALALLRSHYTTSGKKLLQSRLNESMFLPFAKFMILNNVLASKGFIVTDENREDKYLEIVNADNPELLTNLSDYLEALDGIQMYIDYYKFYNKMIESINYAESQEEMNEAWNEYTKHFFLTN